MVTDVAHLLLALCGPGAVGLAPHVQAASHRYHVPPAILVSVARIESRCSPTADDGDGDIGVMQIRLGASAAHGRTLAQLLDARTNILLGARHIRYWWDRCGDLPASLGIYRGSHNCRDGRRSKRAHDVLQFAEQALRPPES